MNKGKLVNISNEEYHAESEHYSSSRLKSALKSLADFKNYKGMGHKPEFDVGHAFEMMLCEPNEVKNNVVVFDDNFRPDLLHTISAKENKAWKEQFYLDNKGKLIVTAKDMNILNKMVGVTINDDYMSQLTALGNYQTSIFWEDVNGLKVKTRPDIVFYLNKDQVVNIDIKTIYSQDQFPKQCRMLNYPFQNTMQVLGLESIGLEVVNSFWLVVDKTDNPTAQLYTFTNQQIGDMKEIYNRTSKRVFDAIQNNEFPTYEEENSNEIGALEIDLKSYFDFHNR